VNAICAASARTVVSFESSLYSVPWQRVRRHMKVELRVSPEEVFIHALGASPDLLAAHRRAAARGSWVVDPSHWEGLPTGGTVVAAAQTDTALVSPLPAEPDFFASRSLAATIPVARRDLATYDQIGALS
jgi:hypothetical protein